MTIWYPPEMWEAHGVPWGVYTPKWTPGPMVELERFCAACACSQKAVEDTPCWNCGGETQAHRPAFWPVGGANETVRGGDSFSVSELEET